jgi:hypothetical protein
MLFVQAAQLPAGATRIVAADPSLRQCLGVLKAAATNAAVEDSA